MIKQTKRMNEIVTKTKVELSKIQWTGPTWNPWHGCKKVSEGCKFCYMYRDKKKYGQDPMAVVKSKTKFSEPLKWKEPQLVFTCSWSDWFIEEADAWRPEAWDVIKNTPHHTYQILTKRPERILECLPEDWGTGYPNVWLGTTVENNNVKQRITALSGVPAAIRFISAEPLIRELNLEDYADIMRENIHWVIIGGESGNDNGAYRYRECKVKWMENLLNECKGYGISVFVKQLGTHLSKELGCKDRHAGKISEWPEQLQVREFPVDVSRFNVTNKEKVAAKKSGKKKFYLVTPIENKEQITSEGVKSDDDEISLIINRAAARDFAFHQLMVASYSIFEVNPNAFKAEPILDYKGGYQGVLTQDLIEPKYLKYLGDEHINYYDMAEEDNKKMFKVLGIKNVRQEIEQLVGRNEKWVNHYNLKYGTNLIYNAA